MIKSNIIVHVSEVEISTNSGMGRVEHYWKSAFEKRGFQFIHIGPQEVGSCLHKGLFPYKAYSYFKKLNVFPKAFIIHEPASGVFVNRGIPCFLESHGVERRSWEYDLSKKSIKTRLFYPLWRLRNCDIGLKKSNKLLLICSEDKIYVEHKYNRKQDDIFVFKNGVIPYKENLKFNKKSKFTVLFNGTWIERKGTGVLIAAAKQIYNNGFTDINYLLIGTGISDNQVLIDWPDYLKPHISIVSRFNSEDEVEYLKSANVFVLPSFSEGQPLSLLQAMSVGMCCITTNCCGQKDIVQNNKTGILFQVGNFKELANQIIKCYNDPKLISTIGNCAKKDMESRSWMKVSDELVDYVISNSCL